MLIALVGATASGKNEVARFLEAQHGFQRVGYGDGAQFASAADMLQHVTANWLTHFVTLDLTTVEDIAPFEKRPFFLLVGVEAPVFLRWKRHIHKTGVQVSLEQFVLADDDTMFSTSCGDGDPDASLAAGVSSLAVHESGGVYSATPGASAPSLSSLLSRCQLRVANTHENIDELHRYLVSLDLTSSHRLRPSWDAYFVSLCTLASMRSNCMKRRVGAVIVRDNRVLSTGYNGTPRGLTNCNEGGCARCNESAPCGSSLDECLCLHAEENALLELGRDRGGAQGTTLYCNTCPCLRCAVKIAQTGVQQVVYQLAYSMDDRSRQILNAAGVSIRQYFPPV
ncbi:dCMP deaminase [Malassezia cuniculi]|uniref:Deoxycytidylate deaminase n=1 Tax=Malassezia cuniculi TaxID=948313 RepID=A0AAF0F0I5_9BASI|nr:dCMP deaminase [Malassezia cuniculi]